MKNMAYKAVVVGLLAVGLMFATCDFAQATLIGVQIRYPIVKSNWIPVSYDADGRGANGLLKAEIGYPNDAQLSPTQYIPYLGDNSSFALEAEVTHAGQGVNGTLMITGDLTGGLNAVPLFSSTSLIGFGFGGDDLFEFIFTQKAGVPTALLPAGRQIGIILDARQINAGGAWNFNADFSGPAGGAYADAGAAVAEPSTCALVVLGALGLIRRRRSR
jgi:hypothetical protein